LVVITVTPDLGELTDRATCLRSCEFWPGINRAGSTDMRAQRLEDLQVWQRGMQLLDAVNAILDKPGLARDKRLRDQLSSAADSIVSNIAEGFPQSTDRLFAKYLYVAKGSTAEVRAQLEIAQRRSYISAEERNERDSLADELARMPTGLIKHLVREQRRDRGLGPTMSGKR
jgi:four helix bundle protein